MADAHDTTAHMETRRIVAGWFDAHVDSIHGYVARRVGRDVARDVTAETFRVALEQFDRFDPTRGNERAWLYGIATNLMRRHWRTEQRLLHNQFRSQAAMPSTGPDLATAVDARLDAERDVERVLAAIDRLAPDDRDLIVLVAWEHLTSAEIAAALDIPASTIRARLRRIRRQLGADHGGPT